MSINKQNLFLGLLILALIVSMVFAGQLPEASAAPLGAVTPVTFSNNGGRLSLTPVVLTIANGTPAAYLTPAVTCYDTRLYNTADAVYTVGSVTAMTITQLYGNDTSILAPGQSLLANNATPVTTPAAVQMPLFNAQNCISIKSGNATPVAVYFKMMTR